MAADDFRKGFGIPERKADGSVVSETDRAVESFVGSTRLDGDAFLVAGRALHSPLLELITEDVA